jgi:hypothetical protein
MGNLPLGISYDAETLVNTGEEINIPYSISSESHVSEGVCNFTVRYYLYLSNNQYISWDTVELQFSINIQNPPTVQEILLNHWPIPLGVVVAFGLVILLYKRYAQYARLVVTKLLGLALIILGTAVGIGTLSLFATTGIHILPPLSYYIWGLILLVILGIFAVGHHLLVHGAIQGHGGIGQKRCMMTGCEEIATSTVRGKDGQMLSVCNKHRLEMVDTV